MNRYFRFIFWTVIALFVFFPAFPAYSSSLPNQISATNDLFRLGIEKLELGQVQDAIETFTQAIENKIHLRGAYSNRCLAFLQLQEYHNAVKDCTSAIEISDNTNTQITEAYLNRGLAHYRLGELDAAIVDYNQVLSIKPHDFRAYYNRGVANAAKRNNQEAILDYNLALTLIPQQSNDLLAEVYNDLGLAYFELTDLETAMSDFNLAVRLNNKNDRAYFNLGCTCARKGNNFAAINHFTQVIQLNPKNANAYVNRGVAYHRLGYEPAAIADLRKASEFFNNQGDRLAYQQTLHLLKSLQQQIISQMEIG